MAFEVDGLSELAREVLLDRNTFEDFKVAWETVVDVYPEVQRLPRISSAWKAVPDQGKDYQEYITPIGCDGAWIVVRRTKDGDVLLRLERW